MKAFESITDLEIASTSEMTETELKLVGGGSEFSDYCAYLLGWAVGRSGAILHSFNNPPSSAIGRGV